VNEDRLPMSDRKPIEIDLSDSDLQPLKIGAEALAELSIVADRMVQACEVSGTSIDAMLETLKPRKVGPDDRIGVNVTAGEKRMLVGLADLEESIKDQIRLVQPKQRRREFTLRQINEIECAISRAMADMSDEKARRQWLSLDGKFLGIQTKHVCGDRPENSLGRALAGEPVSRGAAVREALMKMIEARRPKRKRPASAPYSTRQGQYLAFIESYIGLHGQAPAERDMEYYFRVSPPAVHQMVLTLEKRGFIQRTPGMARSIRLLISREALPDLEQQSRR